MKTAQEILDSVGEVLGAREKNYDNPRPNFQRIADYWTTYLGIPILPEQVAIMMILMKVAREQFKHTEDNLTDAIGYAVCALRIAEDENDIKF